MAKNFSYNGKYFYFMFRTVFKGKEDDYGDNWYRDVRYAIEDLMDLPEDYICIEVYLIDEDDESNEILIGDLFDGDIHNAMEKIKEAAK